MDQCISMGLRRLIPIRDQSFVSSVHQQIAQANNFVVCDHEIFVRHVRFLSNIVYRVMEKSRANSVPAFVSVQVSIVDLLTFRMVSQVKRVLDEFA